MATPTSTSPESSADPRQRSEVRFPARNLADSLAVAKAIHQFGGGKASADQLAAFLGYKSTSNGAYLARVGAARLFGLVGKRGDDFIITALAEQILMPTYPEQAKQGQVTAFLNVELFRRIYEDFKGKELPPEFGMKNALRNIYKVGTNRIDVSYRTLMDSAEDAGFFSTRGARTHLIMPLIQPVNAPPQNEVQEEIETGGASEAGMGSSGEVSAGAQESKSASTIEAAKARYLEALISTLEEKGKSGELDTGLMERIEKLLGVSS